MNGSWGTAGNYNVTLSFVNAKDFTESSSASKLRLTIASSTSATYQTIAEVAANSTTLARVDFTFDVSKFVTPASLQKVYCKFVMVSSDGSILVNSNLTNGTIKSALGDDYATLAYAKANEPPSTLTFTTSNSNYQDFDKPLTISWNAVTQTGSYAPHHYKVWIRFSYDNGTTWVTDNNYIGIGWGIEGTSYTFTLKDLHLDTKNLSDYSRFKLRIGMATLDNKNGSEVTRSSVKWFVMTPYVINTSSGNLSLHTANNGQVSIGINNVKMVQSTGDMKVKILDDGSEWARIFWHDVSESAVYFSNSTEVGNCNLLNRFSRLTYVGNFEYDGKYEFMLCYPKYSTTKYNRWIQTANPLYTNSNATQTVDSMGYKGIHIDFKTNWYYGMGLSSSSQAYMDCEAGHGNWYGGIGLYSAYNGGFPAPTESGMSNIQKEIELWVRVYRSVKVFSKNQYEFNVNAKKIYVHNYNEFKTLRNTINNSPTSFKGRIVELMGNIEITEESITGGATGAYYSPISDFYGTLEGNGFCIKTNDGLMNDSGTYTGTMNIITKNFGTIKNLRVDGKLVNWSDSGTGTPFGGICGENQGLIYNCYSTRSYVPTGNSIYGGICGYNTGVITRCIYEGDIGLDSTSQGIFGGIVARNNGEVSGCRCQGALVSGNNAGGIAGYTLANSIIRNCSSITSICGTYAGGIVGYSYKGDVANCYAASSLGEYADTIPSSYNATYGGGICGYNNYGTYSNNYYDSKWKKASSEYSSSTLVNCTSMTASSMSNYDFPEKLGNAYVYRYQCSELILNKSLPLFDWETVSSLHTNDCGAILPAEVVVPSGEQYRGRLCTSFQS